MTLKLLLAALLALPHYREDTPGTPEKLAQHSALSAAIRAEARTADEAAFLLAWGDAETHYSLRVHSGRCKPHECDRGRARGPWQLHRDASMSADTWARMHGVENTPLQAREAAKKVRWALRQCPANRIVGAFRVLGGRGCQYELPGENERVAMFERVRRRM